MFLSTSAPFAGYVFKSLIDPFMGHMNYVRVYSGSLATDAGFLNSTRGVKEKGGKLFHATGKKYVQVEAAVAGDIVAMPKRKDRQTGHTLITHSSPPITPRPR